MSLIAEQYKSSAFPSLKEKFGYKNLHEVPRIEKVVVNIGTGRALTDKALMEAMESTLERITGQKPLQRKARKSISNFSIREGQVVGLSVTLRGAQMEAFLDKLVNVTLPRIRDFRGIPETSFDGNGNYTLGIREHNVFPEIRSDEVEHLHGMQITISTSATTNEEARALLDALGFPFQKPEDK